MTTHQEQKCFHYRSLVAQFSRRRAAGWHFKMLSETFVTLQHYASNRFRSTGSNIPGSGHTQELFQGMASPQNHCLWAPSAPTQTSLTDRAVMKMSRHLNPRDHKPQTAPKSHAHLCYYKQANHQNPRSLGEARQTSSGRSTATWPGRIKVEPPSFQPQNWSPQPRPSPFLHVEQTWRGWMAHPSCASPAHSPWLPTLPRAHPHSARAPADSRARRVLCWGDPGGTSRCGDQASPQKNSSKDNSCRTQRNPAGMTLNPRQGLWMCQWAQDTSSPASHIEVRFPSSAVQSPLVLATTPGKAGTQLWDHTHCTAQTKRKIGSQKLQGIDCQSQQVTNRALGLFLFSTETRLSRFLTQALLKWAETCSSKSSEVQYLYHTEYTINYYLHATDLQKVTYNVKKYSIFCSFFCFKFFSVHFF